MPSYSCRQSFKLVIYLFSEGDTELDYLQKFVRQQGKKDLVQINRIMRNPNPVTLVQMAIKQFKDLREIKQSEVWVIFDHDGRNKEVRKAIDLVRQSGKDIHIAFMKPCMEIWPLLHRGIDNVSTPDQAQQKLAEVMPAYRHNGSPYFDLIKMTDYDGAVTKAKQWKQSLGEEPEYNASKYAGIYELTERIKNIR